MSRPYKEWQADYAMALERGRDAAGRDMFDLLYEKMADARIALWFDCNFLAEDQATSALQAFEARGYDDSRLRSHEWERVIWILRVSRTLRVVSADTLSR